MIWRVSTKYTYRKNDRLAGDTELQNNIDKEATERANQDTLINNAIAQEKQIELLLTRQWMERR